MNDFAPATCGAIRRKLLAWYVRHQRVLPWRAVNGSPVDPYHVLVSETMLQQTQVATVMPYFQRFIARFPTVRELADADEQQVLRLWQGLGYYRRARHLHQAAKRIVDEHHARVPADPEQLLDLPGVGRYTAGAVASIAFGEPEPVVDGNVARVLARLALIDEPVNTSAVQKHLWRLARQLVPPKRPGDFNQALMELGSTVCVPRNPECENCPLQRHCLACQQDAAERLPATAKRTPPRDVVHVVVALHRRGRYLVTQRPTAGLWSKMWQLPTAENLDSYDDPAAIRRWMGELTGLGIARPQPIDSFIHMTSHRRIRFDVWHADVTGGRTKRGVGQWRRLNDLADLPLARPQQRVVRSLEQLQPASA